MLKTGFAWIFPFSLTFLSAFPIILNSTGQFGCFKVPTRSNLLLDLTLYGSMLKIEAFLLGLIPKAYRWPTAYTKKTIIYYYRYHLTNILILFLSEINSDTIIIKILTLKIFKIRMALLGESLRQNKNVTD